jgi:hypothetical protein
MLTPHSETSWTSAKTRATCSKALDGIQPLSRQVPPKRGSITSSHLSSRAASTSGRYRPRSLLLPKFPRPASASWTRSASAWISSSGRPPAVPFYPLFKLGGWAGQLPCPASGVDLKRAFQLGCRVTGVYNLSLRWAVRRSVARREPRRILVTVQSNKRLAC